MDRPTIRDSRKRANAIHNDTPTRADDDDVDVNQLLRLLNSAFTVSKVCDCRKAVSDVLEKPNRATNLWHVVRHQPLALKN